MLKPKPIIRPHIDYKALWFIAYSLKKMFMVFFTCCFQSAYTCVLMMDKMDSPPLHGLSQCFYSQRNEPPRLTLTPWYITTPLFQCITEGRQLLCPWRLLTPSSKSQFNFKVTPKRDALLLFYLYILCMFLVLFDHQGDLTMISQNVWTHPFPRMN